MHAADASPLTSDYVNHFGELVMLLDLLPDAPHLIEDAKRWRPRSYREHLDAISFAAAGPLRDAYEKLEPARRDALDRASAEANRLGAAIAAALRDSDAHSAELTGVMSVGGAALHAHIRRLSAILAGRPLAEEDCGAPIAQAEMEVLFASP